MQGPDGRAHLARAADFDVVCGAGVVHLGIGRPGGRLLAVQREAGVGRVGGGANGVINATISGFLTDANRVSEGPNR